MVLIKWHITNITMTKQDDSNFSSGDVNAEKDFVSSKGTKTADWEHCHFRGI